jgi:hypothetical protein
MIGMELAVVRLGMSVIKSACALWLGRAQPASADSPTLIEMLAGRMSGVMEQRRLARQFDQMGDAAAEKLLGLLAHEFAALAEYERLAAIQAVQDTFDSVVLTDEAVFGADLDPVYLDRLLRRATPDLLRRAALSRDGQALYDLLLRESCTYVVEIVTALPRFEASVLVEILRRETAILTAVRDVLARLPERRSLGDTGFEADYRRQVINRLDRLELFGVTLPEASCRYPLSVAYVSLSTSSSRERQTYGRPAGVTGFGSVGVTESLDPELGGVRIEQTLTGCDRLLLRGDAGSGKTSLLQWLAVSSALRRFGSGLESWNRLVPFFIPLRRHVDTDLPPPQRFLDHVGAHIADEMPKGWVHELLGRDERWCSSMAWMSCQSGNVRRLGGGCTTW